jgi:hypothetical protein
MSFDLRVFFPQASFPEAEWRGILESFGSAECLVRFEPPDGRGVAITCDLVVDDSVVSAGVGAIEPGYWARVSKGAKWQAALSTSAGRSLRAFWIQFAIPYHALVLIPGVAAHAEPDLIFHDTERWLEFCRERLWGPVRQKEQMVDRGLFLEDGTPRF